METRIRSWLRPYIAGIILVALLMAVSLFVLYQSHDNKNTLPFRINSDSEMTSMASWMRWPGNGSSERPYIIDGLAFQLSTDSPGVFVGNTTQHITISNSTFRGTLSTDQNYDQTVIGHAIELFNLRNIMIRDCTITNCSIGISLQWCRSSCLVNNIIMNYEYPDMGESIDIWLNHSDTVTLTDNNLTGNLGIRMDNSSQNIISHNYGSPLHAYYSSQNQLLRNNLGWGARQNAIFLSVCNDTHIEQCRLLNLQDTLWIENSSGCRVNDNLIVTRDHTATFIGAERMVFENNSVYNANPLGLGMMTIASSNNVTFKNNSFSGGVWISDSHHNIIEKNSVRGDFFSGPALVLSKCDSNILRGNDVTGGSSGFWLNESNGNQLLGNIINRTGGNHAHGFGILMENSSENIATLNQLLNCAGSGDNWDESHIQAFDNTGSNFWNDTSAGNYWSDWGGPLSAQPYIIDGGAGATDLRPLSAPPVI